MASLLAVDLGLRTGMALYDDQGRLCWYRSHNYGTPARLKRAVPPLLGGEPDLAWLVLEGGGPLATVWEHAAERCRVDVCRVAAEDWRAELLLPREQRGTQVAKRAADQCARRVIAWSDAPRPTSLRHDAAEAILLGLWGVLHVGWLPRLPVDLHRRA